MLLSKSGVTVEPLVNVAVLSVPPATMPPDHLAVVVQAAGVVEELFHVPLWARAVPGVMARSPAANAIAVAAIRVGDLKFDISFPPAEVF
jgi:hypothetical protein